jgi:hypothetical protein
MRVSASFCAASPAQSIRSCLSCALHGRELETPIIFSIVITVCSTAEAWPSAKAITNIYPSIAPVLSFLTRFTLTPLFEYLFHPSERLPGTIGSSLSLRARNGFDVNKDTHNEPTHSTAILTKAPQSGLPILIGYVAVLLFAVWIARAHRMEIPDAVGLAMICFSFGWTYLSIWKLVRGGLRLGWNRSNLTKLLTGPRPDDPDELFMWRWTLQLCCASLSVVVCVVILAFSA